VSEAAVDDVARRYASRSPTTVRQDSERFVLTTLRAAWRWRSGVAAAMAIVMLAACSDVTIAAQRGCGTSGLPTTVAYARFGGVDPNLTSVDIHSPDGPCAAPVVVWVHGGGYTIGDKTQQMENKVRLFNQRGWILVSVNYRLTRPGDSTSARYPDHYSDVAAAVGWVRSHIADYGGDPQRIALLGHSAGADIVSNVLLNPAYLDAVGMTAADLACAGPLDSEGFDKFAAGTADIRGLQQEWRTALGNAPDYLRSTSANWLIAAGRDVPPIIGVVRGSTRRRAIETAFLTKLDAIGVPTTSIDASTLTHHEVNSRIGARGDRVMTPPLMRFLDRCLGVQVLDD